MSEARTLTLEAGGDVLSIESDEFAAVNGGSGFMFSDVEVRWTEGAGDGSTYQSTRYGRRVLPLPVLVRGRDADDLQRNLSRLARVLNRRNAPATLRMGVGPESWWVKVVRTGGGDPVWGEGTNGSSYALLDLVLEAGDPFWTRERAEQFPIRPPRGRGLLKQPTDETGAATTPAGGGLFGEGEFGAGAFGAGSGATYRPTASLTYLRQSSGQAMGTVTLENGGDTEAEVLTILQGPATGLDLIGPSGDSVIWRANIDQGEVRVFDHAARTVRDGNGADRYDELATVPVPVFWDVPPDTSTATVVMYGADDAASVVTLTWRPRREVLV